MKLLVFYFIILLLFSGCKWESEREQVVKTPVIKTLSETHLKPDISIKKEDCTKKKSKIEKKLCKAQNALIDYRREEQ